MTDSRWGCPDWREANEYPTDGNALSDSEWMWQFLRRSPDYRKLWQEAEGEITASSSEIIDWIRSLLNETEFPKDELEIVINLVSKRFVEHCELRFLRSNPENYQTREFLILRHGMGFLVDPCATDIGFGNYGLGGSVINGRYGWLPNFDEIRSWLTKAHDGEPLSELEAEIASRRPLLTFLNSEYLGLLAIDLMKPIVPQLESAKKDLNKRQQRHLQKIEQMKANRRSNWPRHLRVIDAVDQRATHQEIWEIIQTESIQMRPDCPEIGSEQYERLVDLEIYSPSKNKQLNSRVNDWIADARSLQIKASRYL